MPQVFVCLLNLDKSVTRAVIHCIAWIIARATSGRCRGQMWHSLFWQMEATGEISDSMHRVLVLLNKRNSMYDYCRAGDLYDEDGNEKNSTMVTYLAQTIG